MPAFQSGTTVFQEIWVSVNLKGRTGRLQKLARSNSQHFNIAQLEATEEQGLDMTNEEREFFEDLIHKVRTALEPDFKATNEHTTATVTAAENRLSSKIDQNTASIQKIVDHFNL